MAFTLLPLDLGPSGLLYTSGTEPMKIKRDADRRGASKPKSITQPADWWAAFEKQAGDNGQTLSEWVGDCCVANLPAKVQRQLSERPPANRPRSE